MKTLKLCSNRDEWDDFILDNCGHPLQLWGWGEVKSNHGWEVYRLQFCEEGDVLGAVQLLIKHLPWPLKSLAYVPRGPVVSEGYRAELLLALAEHVKKTHHSVVLSVEPDSVNYDLPDDWKWRKSNNRILPSNTVILDLDKTGAELQAEMAKKTRQYIRKSASENIVIKTVRKKEDLDKCMSLYHSTAKRAKFDLHSDDYYYDVFNYLKGNSQIFAAYVDNEPVSFLWLAISANTAFELYGGMNEVGQQLRANYALKWHGILKCKEWGLTRYDFGGLIEGGVSTFKMGWTEKETDLAGTFDLPLSPAYFIWNRGLPTAKMLVRAIKGIIKR